MAEFEVADAEAFERDVLDADEPTVVVFWASWCPFCRMFRRVFDAQAAKSAGRFAVARVDDPDNPLWERYAIDVIPSLAYFRGRALVARKDGTLGEGLSGAELAAFLREVSVTS